MTKLIDPTVDFDENTDGLVIKKTQEIPTWFVDQLKDSRFESKNRPSGDYHRAASIPTILVEKWMSEGYDVYNEPVKKTLAKLKAEGLDYFITTDKTL